MRINVYRGNFIESVHDVTAVVINHEGKVLHSSGDINKKIFPRSAIKPIQALPLIQSGAFEQFDCNLQELACACASHHGEKKQTTIIASWLERIGAQISDLECGSHVPYDKKTEVELILNDEKPSAIHNNCSGKHTAQIALAKYLKVDIKNYVSANHPVQKLIFDSIKSTCHSNLSENDFAIDGCSIPAFFMPIQDVAFGMATLASRSKLNDKENKSYKLVYDACTQRPDLTTGSGEFCDIIMKELKGKALVKIGAEGVMAVSIPELNAGICVKVHDGSDRASKVATSFILDKLGLFKSFSNEQKSNFLKPKLYNRRNIEVGFIQNET